MCDPEFTSREAAPLNTAHVKPIAHLVPLTRPRAVLPRIDAGAPLSSWSGDPAWALVPALSVSSFRPESSCHHPRVLVKAAHSARALCAVFLVEDRYVLARQTQRNSPVYQDSCVEWFIQPRPDRGYFAFEVNCAGVWFASYTEGPPNNPDVPGPGVPLPPSCADEVEVHHSINGPILEEIVEPVTWTIGIRIPIRVLAEFAGPLKPITGRVFRGNFYKCADRSSHPHWAAWAPVGALDFHRPSDFGELVLD